jgi:hypothetical protein
LARERKTDIYLIKEKTMEEDTKTEQFQNLDEEQLEAIVGGGGCIGCLRDRPANEIRTPVGNTDRTKPARNVGDAYRGWESEHPTPEAKRTATWYPKSIEVKGRTYWVKDPIPS